MDLILNGFAAVLNLPCVALMFLGVAVGVIFGAIPGLTGTMGVSLCLSLTFGFAVPEAFSLLLGLYVGGVSGGLISAILINIPGTPSSIATTFDGHPMAQKGQAGKALGISLLYSFIGGIVSIVILMFLAPVVAKVAIKFGPQEYFAVGIFSLTMLSIMVGKDTIKSIASCVLGISFALIGTAPIDNVLRYTFGMHDLISGFSLLPVMIGLFAVSEAIKMAAEGFPIIKKGEIHKYKFKGFGITLKEFRKKSFNMIRSIIIGTGIGILPGIGGGTSNIISYTVAKSQSKHPEEFGKGATDGLIASEAANNASIGGAMVPLLTLGIPGDTVTAILLGAMILHGLNPGPLLFTKDANIVYMIFAIMILVNVIMLIEQYFGMKVFVKLLKIPKHILIPIVILLCTVGAFGNNNRIFDISSLVFFGVVGYLLVRYRFGLPPFILGFILCPIIERNMRKSLSYTHGDWSTFFTHPIAAVFLAIAILTILLTVFRRLRQRKKERINL